MVGVVQALLEDTVFLVIISIGKGFIDVDGTGRSGRPFAHKEVLYRKGGEEPIVPGYEACSFRHDRRVRGQGKGGKCKQALG